MFADGGILATGTVELRKKGLPVGNEIFLAKYTFEGELDRSFGADGLIVATPRGMAMADHAELTSDGEIILQGRNSAFSPMFLKFTAAGKNRHQLWRQRCAACLPEFQARFQ